MIFSQIQKLKSCSDRCRTMNVTDEYFDACVFDLMLTGRDLLAILIVLRLAYRTKGRCSSARRYQLL